MAAPALLAMILPAFAPVLADGLRAIFNRVTKGAGVRPANVGEAVQLMEAEAKWVAAMGALDSPGPNVSRWVSDLRGSYRYLAATFIISLAYGLVVAHGAGYLNVPMDTQQTLLDMAGSAFSFIFGDRMYAHLKRNGK